MCPFLVFCFFRKSSHSVRQLSVRVWRSADRDRPSSSSRSCSFVDRQLSFFQRGCRAFVCLFVCLLGFLFLELLKSIFRVLFVCLSDSLLLSQSISGLISKSWLRASRCCGTWKYASRLLLFFFNSGHRNSNLESEEVRGGGFVGRRVDGRRCCYCLRFWLQQYVSFMLGTLLLLLLLLPCSPLL